MRLVAALMAAGCAYGAAALYRQSAAAALASHSIPAEYVLVDVREGKVAAAKWSSLETPVPIGSLLKPFVVAARKGPYPMLRCDGSQCWKRHGRIGLTEALAYSCNSYFLRLLQDTSSDDLNPGMQRLGLPPFPPDAAARTFIGLDGKYQVRPETLISAFAGVAEELKEGLELAVRSGTASGAAVSGVLGKTGTSQCRHEKRGQGDGFALLWSPDWAVLVRVHNTTGANAAITAGEILRVVRK